MIFGISAPTMQAMHGRLDEVSPGFMRHWLVACSALACCAVVWSSPQAKAQSMMDQIIFNKCSSAMQADYQKAGKTPPAGLVTKTCNCVVKEVDATHNIDTAKTICTSNLTGS